ncbi:MAG: hypothetical protein MK180_10395 [Rhodobacteraceae bacterium]|nr:hypothetical protein [Paracoccaceae bacterium]
MSGLKTLLLAMGLLSAAPLTASGGIEFIFAGCVGRYSAQMEHAWLLGQNAEDEEEKREVFLSLLEATMDAEQAEQVLAHRIASKMSQASLLTVAEFATDTDTATRAVELSQSEIQGCRSLLLDS